MIHQYVPRHTGEIAFELLLPLNYQPIELPGRDEWLEALRSGRYNQTRGALVNAQGYCCLGVACRVMGLLGGDYGFFGVDCPKLYTKSLPIGCYMQLVIGTHGTFPDGVAVRTTDGMIGGACHWVTLTNLNDKLDLNFHQIAWVIERIWSQP